MSRRGGIALAGLALAALGTAGARAEVPESGLQPYQMVRSLQLVQDRIAGGDHAALPMQKKLLELIDARFRKADGSDFEDRRNFQALMIYAMSGGNPSTVAASLARLQMNEADSAAGDGVVGYLTGDVGRARSAMATVEPANHPQEMAAFLSLVKGSVVASEDAKAGMAMLDRARLLSPGTLVEEAALRRTLSLAVAAGDGEKFLSVAEQYARRYLRSPYASQFAEAFVTGIIELNERLDMRRIEQAVAWMTQEQARTVYLRLARRAAIDGNPELLAFASRKARDRADELDGSDPRSELYASISSVTSDTVDEVLSRLQELDASQLSAADRALLRAARTIAAEVVAPVTPRAAVPAVAAGDEEDTAETDALVLSARSRLEAIDRMLEEGEP